jgi:hypothetical protein
MKKAIMIDTPEGIEAYRILALKGALKLEIAGMKGRGRSAYSILKSEFGFKGSRQSVLDQLQKIVDETLS